MKVLGRGLGGGRVHGGAPVVQDDSPLAQTIYRRHVVTDEENRSAAFGRILHLPEALLLELGVSDGQDFVYEEDLRFKVGGHGEG